MLAVALLLVNLMVIAIDTDVRSRRRLLSGVSLLAAGFVLLLTFQLASYLGTPGFFPTIVLIAVSGADRDRLRGLMFPRPLVR